MVIPSRIYNALDETISGWGMKLRTDFAGGIGHGSNDLGGRPHHFRELADGNTGENADEKLVL